MSNLATHPSLINMKFVPNGHIECSLCSTYWCEHIEKVVTSGYDVSALWEKYAEEQFVAVPMIPTANQWAIVKLTEAETHAVPTYTVTLDDPDLPFSSHTVGYIHESEGRAVLRSMVIDWFWGTQEALVNGCESRGHGYKQEMAYKRDIKNDKGLIAQKWSIWSTKKCLGCTFDLSGNPDLVPPADPVKSPFS